ncbi:methionine biosynthesis protein MetW [Henriciella aquimarina]|uniref:methionine biosynthesis protein MetW n=1 Tax=Henriciella aquimarina TaxID=545261 RepID=UPI000A00C25C|nr:methionine biosynthesis protein MetW [Henriciella aquimarina]
MAETQSIRADHLAIATRVPEGARVLDVGCGNGDLLALLQSEKHVNARGLELSAADAGVALARGLSVIQGDADSDLGVFPDNGFDVAILSKAIQQMRRPVFVLQELARIAPEMIVSFRNFGLWQRRISLMTSGRMPGHRAWHDEGALHPSTARDMIELSTELGLEVVAMAPMHRNRVGGFRDAGLSRLNWGADEVILHLRRT